MLTQLCAFACILQKPTLLLVPPPHLTRTYPAGLLPSNTGALTCVRACPLVCCLFALPASNQTNHTDATAVPTQDATAASGTFGGELQSWVCRCGGVGGLLDAQRGGSMLVAVELVACLLS